MATRNKKGNKRGSTMPNSDADPMPATPAPLDALRGYSHRRRFGDVEVVALCDGHVDLTLANFPGLSEEVAAPLLARDGLAVESFPVSVTAFVIRKSGRTYLVDAGTGDARGDHLGHLPAALAAAGVAPEEIDAVVMMHLHVDHCAGLYDGDRAVFANAELLVAEAEYAFWKAEDRLDERQRTQLEYAKRALEAYAGRTTRFSPEEAIEGLFEPLPLPGHTPGRELTR
jgi:glyoxylase-like metal-dependent hydrolase (beta-lactamase superfamily II)